MLAEGSPAPKLLAQHLSAAQRCEAGFRLEGLPVFDRSHVQVRKTHLQLQSQPEFCPSSCFCLPPREALHPAAAGLPHVGLTHPSLFYSQGTVVFKLTSTIQLDDGTGVINVICPAAAGNPGVELVSSATHGAARAEAPGKVVLTPESSHACRSISTQRMPSLDPGFAGDCAEGRLRAGGGQAAAAERGPDAQGAQGGCCTQLAGWRDCDSYRGATVPHLAAAAGLADGSRLRG